MQWEPSSEAEMSIAQVLAEQAKQRSQLGLRRRGARLQNSYPSTLKKPTSDKPASSRSQRSLGSFPRQLMTFYATTPTAPITPVHSRIPYSIASERSSFERSVRCISTNKLKKIVDYALQQKCMLSFAIASNSGKHTIARRLTHSVATLVTQDSTTQRQLERAHVARGAKLVLANRAYSILRSLGPSFEREALQHAHIMRANTNLSYPQTYKPSSIGGMTIAREQRLDNRRNTREQEALSVSVHL